MKRELYYVRPTSQEARIELVNYLEEHGFTYTWNATRESTIESTFPIVIKVIPKTVCHICQTFIAACASKALVSEEDFYEQFESRPHNLIVWKKQYDADQVFIYEGYTYKNHPYGAGTSYYPDGTKYQEGVFDVKGLVCGREYYPNGLIRFEGAYKIHKAYGPNPPVYGNYYDQTGSLIYSGEFQLQYGGVGYPTVITPKNYGPVEFVDRPRVDWLMWEEKEELE